MLLLVFGTVISAQAAETITFESKTPTEESIMLTGKVTKPQGDGPFPAVVMLHDCAGINYEHYDNWSKRLSSWGYATLQLDSFTPRGQSNICAPGHHSDVSIWTRMKDAYDAKSYLGGIRYVDDNRIAVMGWGHGGWTIPITIDKDYWIDDFGEPFRAAVAFYPWCDASLSGSYVPLLILAGELDTAMPVERCRSSMPSEKTTHEVILQVYPGAYHRFDWEGIDENWGSHILKYDSAASSDAIVRVKNFLAKYMK